MSDGLPDDFKCPLVAKPDPGCPSLMGITASYCYEPRETCNVWIAREVPPGMAALIVRTVNSRGSLLEACKELLAAYEDGCSQCYCSNSGYDAPSPCISCKVRSAIKQAEETHPRAARGVQGCSQGTRLP